MKISKEGLDFIKKEEGLRLTSYPDGVNVWTIGYGHTSGIKPNMTITPEQAEKYLKEDIEFFEKGVNDYVINKGILLEQSQFDALVSLVFNVGLGSIFTKDYGNFFGAGSTLYNHLKNFRYNEAAERFTDFKKAGGVVVQALLNRREREKAVFLKSTQLVKKKAQVVCPSCGCLYLPSSVKN